MSEENLYESYRYARRRRKFPFFIILFIVLLGGIAFLVSNIFLGFFSFSGAVQSSATATLPAVSVWSVEIDSFSSKTSAMSCSKDVKERGGAGYVFSGETWGVLDNAYATKQEAETVWNALDENVTPNARIRQFSCESIEVQLRDKSHKEIFDKLVASFYDNFVFFNEQIAAEKSAEEICTLALKRYNELGALVKEMDSIQENAANSLYARLIIGANKQLIALYLLSTDGTVATVKTSVCKIIFAYFDFVNG